MFIRIFFLTILLLTTASGENLTIEALFQHPRVWGTSPSSPKWSPDGKFLAFLWNENGERFKDLYLADISRNKIYRLTFFQTLPELQYEEDKRTKEEKEEQKILDYGVSAINWFPDNRHILVSYKGDFFIADIKMKEPVAPYIRTTEYESSPEFSPEHQELLFVRNCNLWIKNTENGAEIQATREGSSKKPIGKSYYLGYLDEKDLTQWSPDGKKIAIVQYDLTELPELLIPDYLGDKVRTSKQMRSRAGEKLAPTRIGIVDRDSTFKTPLWLKIPEKNEFYLRSLKWSPDSKKLAFEFVDKSQKNRYICIGSAENGEVDTVYQETDSLWIGDLGSELFWIRNGSRLLFGSEKKGWHHLYELEYVTGLEFPLTAGKWEVHDYKINPESKKIFFSANREDPATNHVYTFNLKSENIEQITYQDGWYDFYLSKDDKSLAYIYSTNKMPPDLYYSGTRSRSTLKRITYSQLPEFTKYNINPPEFREFRSHIDGKTIHAKIWTPLQMTAGKKYPVVVYVHGAGYAQSNVNRWRLFDLWHQYLSEKGYIVLDVDYRGSSGYGRDWRTDVYRHLGELDLADVVTVLRKIQELPYVDTEKVAIWGWSYGGFLTQMAMFKEPDIFKTGISVAGVADWEKYNLWYTTQRFNYPENDSIAYAQSSPINYVKGLKGNLLIVHGIKDSNVHFQDTVLLMDALIKAGKPFDSILYPRENHGFSRDESLIHLFHSMESYLGKYLK